MRREKPATHTITRCAFGETDRTIQCRLLTSSIVPVPDQGLRFHKHNGDLIGGYGYLAAAERVDIETLKEIEPEGEGGDDV